MVALRKMFSWFSRQPTDSPSTPSNITQFPNAASPSTIEDIMDATIREAMALSEVYEPGLAKTMHWVYSLLAYALPPLAAIAAGWWIGDGYSGSFNWTGESVGVHIISLFGEIALCMLTISSAISAKQVVNDDSRRKMLIYSILALIFFSAASATAQWFLILHNVEAAGYDPTSGGILAMLGFRVVMPLGIDVASLIYLTVYGHRSLKHRLAQLDQQAEAVEKLNARKLAMQALEEKVRRDQEDIELERERRRRADDLVNRIQEINAQATLSAIERHMLKPGVVESDARPQRRGFTQPPE